MCSCNIVTCMPFFHLVAWKMPCAHSPSHLSQQPREVNKKYVIALYDYNHAEAGDLSLIKVYISAVVNGNSCWTGLMIALVWPKQHSWGIECQTIKDSLNPMLICEQSSCMWQTRNLSPPVGGMKRVVSTWKCADQNVKLFTFGKQSGLKDHSPALPHLPPPPIVVLVVECTFHNKFSLYMVEILLLTWKVVGKFSVTLCVISKWLPCSVQLILFIFLVHCRVISMRY